MNKEELKKRFEENPEATKSTMMVLSVVMEVFSDAKEAVPFMELVSKMIDEPEFIPDKIFVFPGKHPEAEYKLKEMMKIILGRRI